MSRTSYSLVFPEYFWLASLLLAAALPPFAFVWIRRRGKLNSDLRWTAGFILTMCVLIGSIDFWNFCVLTFGERSSRDFPGGWLRLAPLLVRAYGGIFVKWTGCVFACSCVLTMLVVAVLRTRGHGLGDR
jgi:hypothetical protein